MKLSGSHEATPALMSQRLNVSTSQLSSTFPSSTLYYTARTVLPSSVPLIVIAPAFRPLLFLTWHAGWADKMGKQSEQIKDRVDE